MEQLRLYYHFFIIHLTGMMQHKVSFFLTTLGQFLVSFNVFLGVHFMMSRFQEVEGFSYSQILLCFSIFLMAFTLAETFFRGFDMFHAMIGNGEFDRVLLRPRNHIFLILCNKIEITRVGRMLQAIIMLIIAIPGSQVGTRGQEVRQMPSSVLGNISTAILPFCLFAEIYQPLTNSTFLYKFLSHIKSLCISKMFLVPIYHVLTALIKPFA